MHSSFITLFCTVYIDWCTVSYLFYLLVCMYLCDVLDDTPFEDQQEQGFDNDDQQQHFEEGKWTP